MGAPEFTFKDQKVRVVMIDGEPWFVAKDVCVALFIHIKEDGKVNTANAVRPLSSDEKGTHRIVTLGGTQLLTVISESGLYRLVLRSDKPEAKVFQDWVTRELLPTIRKTGTYSTVVRRHRS